MRPFRIALVTAVAALALLAATAAWISPPVQAGIVATGAD